MNISLIVAASSNNVIGKNNELPWHLPADMKFFKNTTWGMPVVMGRKTFESLGSKPLAGRMNIIITRQNEYEPSGVVLVNSLHDAEFIAREADCKEVFIIGGGEIFKEAMNKANKIFLTRVHTVIDGDIFFPDIDDREWTLSSSRKCFADEKHAFDYTFELWVRN